MDSTLSNREKQILHLIALEHTSVEISRMLYISPETAKSHRRNMMSKLRARNVAGLIRRAFESGLLFPKQTM